MAARLFWSAVVICALVSILSGCADPLTVQQGMTNREAIRADRDASISEFETSADVAARQAEAVSEQEAREAEALAYQRAAEAEAASAVEQAKAVERAVIGAATQQRIAIVESTRLQTQAHRAIQSAWANVAILGALIAGFVAIAIAYSRKEEQPVKLTAREWQQLEADALTKGILLQRWDDEIKFIDAQSYEIVHVEKAN